MCGRPYVFMLGGASLKRAKMEFVPFVEVNSAC